MNATTTISTFGNLTLSDVKPYALSDIAADPNTPTEVLLEIIEMDSRENSPNHALMGVVAGNKNATTEVIEAIVARFDGDAGKYGSKTIAMNPNTPAEYLMHLSNVKVAAIRQAVVMNPNTPLRVLEFAAKWDVVSVRKAAEKALAGRKAV